MRNRLYGIVWDQAVIAEIMRENAITGAHDAMNNNQDLYLNYEYLLIEQEIAQEAVRRGLCERLDVIHQLQSARRAILVKAMKADFSRNISSPPMVDMQQYYHKNLKQYAVPEAFKLQIFELDTSNNQLMTLVEQMNTAHQFDFQQLLQAGAKSVKSESKTNWFTKKQLHSKIYQALQKMKNHDIQPIRLNTRFFLVQRMSYRKQGVSPFKNVVHDILVKMKKQKADMMWQNYLQDVKKRLGYDIQRKK